MLLQYEANPSALNQHLETPVHCAARAGNLTTLKLLVDKGGLGGGPLQARTRAPSASLPPNSPAASLGDQSDGGSSGRSGSVFLLRPSFTTPRSSVRRGRRRGRRDALALEDGSEAGSDGCGRVPSRNLLSVACESEKPEVVEYLIEEIVRARRECFLKDSCDIGPPVLHDFYGNINNNNDPSFEVIPDQLELRQAAFLELGADLAASNVAVTSEDMEGSVYGKMLAKTPRAFLFMLDSCVHASDKETYIDFFPFYNCEGKSELNILKVRI